MSVLELCISIERILSRFIPVPEIRDRIIEQSKPLTFQLWITRHDTAYDRVTEDVVNLDEINIYEYVHKILVKQFRELNHLHTLMNSERFSFNYVFKIPLGSTLKRKLHTLFWDSLPDTKHSESSCEVDCIHYGKDMYVSVRLNDFSISLNVRGLYFIVFKGKLTDDVPELIKGDYYRQRLLNTIWDVYYTDMEDFQKIEDWEGDLSIFPKTELIFTEDDFKRRN